MLLLVTNKEASISSLKSEALWQFIQKPEGTDRSTTRAADLAALWANAQQAADRASRDTGRTVEMTWR